MREKDSEDLCFRERDKYHPLPTRESHPYDQSSIGTRPLSPFDELSPQSVQSERYKKVLKIKALVEKGQYETEDKIRVTAECIWNILKEAD